MNRSNTIVFHDTLEGQSKKFKPLREGEVGMYTCGPTVYDYAHIGNFRAFVFEDLLRRFLEYKGFKVTHVMNLTDVDDKTIAGASREGKKLDDFTEVYTKAFQEDLRMLNILLPNYPPEQPRATREIPAMLDLIQKLVEKGAAYVSDGSVYYRVAAFPDYGKLSKKKLEQNIAGARVDVDQYEKEEGSDFALWKKAKEGEPAWDSPWGKGRPGWHIECSAMSMKYLGETFDIHAGGEDLIFPHHENEIAQSEAATDKPFVNYWLHCKFLLVNGEKMSKSKGNFYTLRDLLAKGYDPMAIRYTLLSVHYRQPLNFTLQGLKEATEIIEKLRDCYTECLSLVGIDAVNIQNLETKPLPSDLVKEIKENMTSVLDALAKDLNIAIAFSLIFEIIRDINFWHSFYLRDLLENLTAVLDFFKDLDRLLGFDLTKIEKVPDEILQILTKRQRIRELENFKTDKSLQAESDQLRNYIESLGWLVEDGRPGEPSTVRKKRKAWD